MGSVDRKGGTGSSAAARSRRRDQRREQAEVHIMDVERRLGSEIEACSKATTFFDAAPKPKAGVKGRVPDVRVVAADSVSAVLERGRGRAELCDLAVLDFASFTQPGGGYERGTMAQEQSLCAESFLYSVLRRFGGWYAENRRHNINCELYRDRAIVVPRVRFERDRYHSYADVIVAAAPNARRARSEYHVIESTLESAMRDRIRLVLSICDYLGRDKVVLGAFGCGAFGWEAGKVAELLRAELASGEHALGEVVIAVPESRFDDHLARFEHAFATFPEANAAPFARHGEPRASAAPVRDESEEQDWRAYL